MLPLPLYPSLPPWHHVYLSAAVEQPEHVQQLPGPFLQTLLPALCGVISSPDTHGDERFFALRLMSDVLAVALTDAERDSGSGDGRGGCAAGAAAAAAGALDALLRCHVVPLVPVLLQQEEPMPLYALKVCCSLPTSVLSSRWRVNARCPHLNARCPQLHALEQRSSGRVWGGGGEHPAACSSTPPTHAHAHVCASSASSAHRPVLLCCCRLACPPALHPPSPAFPMPHPLFSTPSPPQKNTHIHASIRLCLAMLYTP